MMHIARYISCLLFVLGFSFSASAQLQKDSTVWAEGRVINAETKEAVQAKIIYQSLPYGSRVGSASGSSFSFPFVDGDKYSLTVQAPGFEPAKFLLDPKEANQENKVVRDIELKKGVAPVPHAVGTAVRLDNLTFERGSARITPESYPELDVLVEMLKNNPKMVIQLEGHTESQGEPKTLLQLSVKRVTAIKDYLVERKVSSKRIRTKGFGGTQPLSREDTPEKRAANRRVEVRVIAN